MCACVRAWFSRRGRRDAAYCFIEPGDRTASEAEGVVAVFRARPQQIHLRATVIWCRIETRIIKSSCLFQYLSSSSSAFLLLHKQHIHLFKMSILGLSRVPASYQ